MAEGGIIENAEVSDETKKLEEEDDEAPSMFSMVKMMYQGEDEAYLDGGIFYVIIAVFLFELSFGLLLLLG